MPTPRRDQEPGLFAHIEQSERAAQRDMHVRGTRLTRFVAEREGKFWQEQENGEWWLVPMKRG